VIEPEANDSTGTEHQFVLMGRKYIICIT